MALFRGNYKEFRFKRNVSQQFVHLMSISLFKLTEPAASSCDDNRQWQDNAAPAIWKLYLVRTENIRGNVARCRGPGPQQGPRAAPARWHFAPLPESSSLHGIVARENPSDQDALKFPHPWHCSPPSPTPSDYYIEPPLVHSLCLTEAWAKHIMKLLVSTQQAFGVQFY